MRMMVELMPVMKPPMTGAEMYLSRVLALNSQNSSSQPVVIRVITGAAAMASGDSGVIFSVTRMAPTSAAGAASTPKTKRGEEVRRP